MHPCPKCLLAPNSARIGRMTGGGARPPKACYPAPLPTCGRFMPPPKIKNPIITFEGDKRNETIKNTIIMRIKLLLIAFVCLFADVCHAQKKYTMVVEMTDGTRIVVSSDHYVRTYFRERSLSCPDDHHPHKIDLGMPSGTKWACCNVGADRRG